MSDFMIECPRCNLEHRETLHSAHFIAGGIVCPCGLVIQFQITLEEINAAQNPSRRLGDFEHG
jgi:hypothetical protein